jgi:hypothetical protein
MSLLLDYQAFAQVGNQRCKWVQVRDSSSFLDSLTILPASLQISSPADSSLKILYNLHNNQIRFEGNSRLDSVLVCYSVLPFNLSRKSFKRNPILYDSTDTYMDDYFRKQTPYTEKREEFFNVKGINKTGNLTRGLTLGSNQNATVTSAFNLQLDGQLTDDIAITAAISDQNVPFQPDGNTLQLQDFDRVFIKLSHRLGSLIVGDVVFQNKENYFLKYYKNVQGGLLETKYNFNQKSEASTSVGFAVSKGKFASQVIPSLEGVQGPYRLSGPNGERFIIILANSERVFIDGRQLTRGFNNDYVIDYNLAEITFNTNVLITQFTRIRVDFEYSEQNYTRSLQLANHYQKLGKTDFFVNFYREGDNARNNLIELSDQDKRELSQAGDGLGFVSGIDTVENFRADEVLYKIIDINTPNGLYINVLVYSTNPDSAKFRATFTEVGQGKGDYVRVNSTINGQIYQWVEPINGISQGSFAPLRAVPTPISKQMLSAGLAYNLSKSEKIYGELATTNVDFNRYSSQDDADNQGFALKIGYSNLGKDFKPWKNYQWLANVDYEWNQQNFRPIDRFRYIEFDRDWSVRTDTTQITDNILNVGGGLKKDLNNQITYRFTARQRGEEVNGWQQAFNFSQEIGDFLIKTDVFAMNNQQSTQISDWQRVNTDVSYRHKVGSVGYRYNLDKNKIRIAETDSVINTAMNFDEHVFYLKSADSSKIQLSANYSFRYDNLPLEGRLQRNLAAQTANFNFSTLIRKTQQVSLIFTYRTLNYLIVPNQDNTNRDNVMGRLDWNGSFLAKHIRSELTYATASGRELRREYVFLPVQNGQGTHTWRDDNGDGVPDLNEFYLAINPDERLYIKVFTPTNDYIDAFNNNFSYRLNWEAPRNWQKLKGLKGWLGKFSSISSWTINKRFTDKSLVARLNPFTQLPDNQILANQAVLRMALFFNRNNLQYGWDLNYSDSQQKQLLTNGFEARNRREVRLNTRSNLSKSFNLRLTGARIGQENRSDFLETRNYNILTYQAGPEFSYQPNPEFRLIGTYNYFNKRNTARLETAETPETAQTHQITFEMRWIKISKRNLIANLRFLNIQYQGQLNTPISYEMLEALQPGINWTWTLSWQQRLTNGLQLTINYDGRKSPTTALINIGRMQLTALF